MIYVKKIVVNAFNSQRMLKNVIKCNIIKCKVRFLNFETLRKDLMK